MIYLLRPISLIAFLFVHSSFGHFLLNYPKSLGFSDAQEDDSPCGGFQVSFDNTTDFHVGGDSVYLTTLHPQSNFLFRGTLDQKASGNWMNLLPVIGEYGLGDFCEPSLSTPDSWAGAMGVLQVIQDAEDGVHYQVRQAIRPSE
ncbi:MAG: hypothetical protein M1839_004500 [Geoglossum umbratile]|nr:MAG: hypothetical protein M1839_004500 [Geoglossum umbratile]